MRRYRVAFARAFALLYYAVTGAAQAVTTLLLLIPTFCFGAFSLLPRVVLPVRRSAIRARGRARAWSGVEVPAPYRPEPPPPVPQADGFYRSGRILYETPCVVSRNARWKWLFGDPATWRDVTWRLLDPFVAVVLAGLPLLAIGYGLTMPMHWSPLAVPLGLAVAAAGVLALPWLIRAHALWSRWLLAPSDRATLTGQMHHLARTRTEVVDSQAVELRRIERDLHDGAQARLVAMGMTLSAAEGLVPADPPAAKALIAHAREQSSAALAELRQVVRGIHPPVLAERGLGDAVRALALDSPLKVQVAIDLPVRPDAPVESAAYFAISELLADAAREEDAEAVMIDISHHGPRLRVTLTDDGNGAFGVYSGLGDVERRIAAFDGVLAVSAPYVGPTMVTIDLPHALAGSIIDVPAKMPVWKMVLIVLGHAVGWLPLFPQGIVAGVFKLVGADDPSWFLALHLAEPLQWPTISFMIVTGLLMYGTAMVLSVAHSPDDWESEVSPNIPWLRLG
ncbi:histidine kinase [Microtetraspora sp. NBRC 13810]|uniref:sensor histidine kinase n=1 Tax=Microtetraspora sp. NBRC 13810 TaxID=3030990 RepID=UPI0024A4D289|nr:histidine kinase [Microtetraspora sp. NBRC 13810]GLW12444.1 histidine kinase [Microtetraspora sp. NBRC 13810]